MLRINIYNIQFVALIISSVYMSAFAQKSISNETEKSNKAILGFNQNWTDLPQLSNTLYQNIKSLKSQMIRYPGGTVAHKWDWRTGVTKTNHLNDELHLIEDIKKLAENTGVQIMFDLDIVNGSVQDQIEMLKASKAEIKYLELGNEIYLKDTPKGNDNRRFAEKFPDGFAYADTVNKWVPALRIAFPKAKIGASLIGKTVSPNNIRQFEWNQSVTSRIKDIDAYTYHIYIPEGGNFENQRKSFESAKVASSRKEIWITEYGNLNLYTNSTSYLETLNKLANYVESFADISLSHTLISKPKNNSEQHSKLAGSTNGATFTAEGKLFLQRVK